MPFLEINNARVHMRDLNPEGAVPVIMIHGLYSSLAIYYFTIAPLLTSRYRVVLYDLRGHGESERQEGDYTPATLSEDLLALMDALEIPQAHIVAYSYGATAALHTVLHHPERVLRLALIEAMFLDEAVLGVDGKNNKEGIAAVFEQNFSDYISTVGLSPNGAQAEKIRVLDQHFRQEDRLMATLFSNRELRREAPLESLTLPTLLLYGIQSPYLATGRALASRLASARLHVTLGNHNIPVNRGKWIARQLRNFFDAG
ncbi:MAG: alpha/beta hydrolase [Coriobacteriales bacterium]|jgi:pimeloyl-ACP methyl ester carboxylesterase|nr:alpha/beta hydrolase [Coriobacteriales bacterium]